MKNQHVSPLNEWIPRIESALIDLDEKPQFGGDVFPLENFQNTFRDIFQDPTLEITLQGKGWQKKEELESHFSGEFYVQELFFSSVQHPIYWVIEKNAFRFLMAHLLGGEEASIPFLKDEYVEDFYHFFGAETLVQLSSLSFFKDLTPRLGERYSLWGETNFSSSAFVYNMNIALKDRAIESQLIFSEFFRDDWKYAIGRRGPLLPSQNQLKKIPVELALEVGGLQISPSEFKKVKKGDVILLDRCSYDPEKKKGRLILSVENKPLFRAKMTEKGIKILEYPLYEHVETPMDFEEKEEKEDLYGDLTSDEEVFDEKDISEETPAESNPPKISIEEIPLQMSVEIGRLRMSAQELLQLAPGNLLDLNVRPEEGVSIVLQGKTIAKGELVKLGEVLGVRILHL